MESSRPGDPIQVLVLGSGEVSLNVIQQLAFNPRIRITWAGVGLDKEENKLTTEKKKNLNIVRYVKLDQTSNPMNINSIVDELKPDMVFLCQRSEDWGMENLVASSNLERSMIDESIRAVDAPLITVSQEQSNQT